MHELIYIVVGWLLGLLSSRIDDWFRTKYRKQNVARAVSSEARDLQYRLAIVSFMLAQKYGKITSSYLNWLQEILENYSGSEPSTAISELVSYLQQAKEHDFSAMLDRLRAEEGVGLALKQYSASFIENHLSDFTHFSMAYQSHIHEFRNHFSILNQEIANANDYHKMTWDSSITAENYSRLKQQLVIRYGDLQFIFKRVCDCLDQLIKYDKNKI